MSTPEGSQPGESWDETQPLQHTTVRGAHLALIGFALSRGLLFVVYVVLARLISPTEFGYYTAAGIVTNVGGLFSESGMGAALIRRADRIDEAASTAFFSLLVSGVLLTLGALAVAPLVGLFFRSSEVTALSAALSGGMLFGALAVVPDALLQRRFSYLRRVAVDPLSSVAFAVASIIAALEHAGAWSLVAGAYASFIFSVVSSWAFADFLPRWRLASIRMWKELAAFARPVLGSEIFYRSNIQLDSLLVGRVQGAAALGQYRNGLRLAQQPSDGFINVGAYVLLPALARIAGQPARFKPATQQIYRLIAEVALPLSLMALPLGEAVAVLLLGQRWAPAGHAVAGLCGMLVGQAVISTSGEIFKAVGEPRLLVRMYFVSLAGLLVLGGAAVGPFGLVGVAVAVSVSRCLAGAYSMVLAAPYTGLGGREVLRIAARPVLATVVMVCAMEGFAAVTDPLDHAKLAAIALTVGQVALGTAVYVILLGAGRTLSVLRTAGTGIRSQETTSS